MRTFLRTTFSYRDEGKFLLHELVVMPEHCHFLVTPARLLSLEGVMQLIKGGFSHEAHKQLLRKVEIWQRSFTNQHVRTPEEYQEFRRYIHLNPVKARLCSAPAEYAYSSANLRWAIRMDANPFTAGAKPMLPDKLRTAEAVLFHGGAGYFVPRRERYFLRTKKNAMKL